MGPGRSRTARTAAFRKELKIHINAKEGNHVKFVGSLKKGETVGVDVRDKGDKLYLIELTIEQRKRIGIGR